MQERREADRWIPVSEGLPDIQKDGDKDFSEWVSITLNIGKNNYAVGRAYYCFSEQKWYGDKFGIGEVTAWKPLSKPYESEEKEDQPERKAYDGRKVGDEFANNYGIYRVTKIDGYACYESVRIMTKEAFIEAYNKYIANAN